MPYPPVKSSSIRLQRLSLALILVLLGTLIAGLSFLDFQQVRRNEKDKLSTQALLVSTNLALHMRSANHVLQETLALMDFATTEQQAERMHSLVNAMPLIRGIGMLDEFGRLVVSTGRINVGTDLSDRPYYRNVMANPQRQRLYISTPYKGFTGSASIALSMAILDHTNRFRGVVYAVLQPDYVEMLLGSTLYTQDMWAALMHIEGGEAVRVGARLRPEEIEAISVKELSAHLPQWENRHRGAFVGGSGDNAQVVAASAITGYAGNTDRPLLVVAGRNYHDAMAGWRRLAAMQWGLYLLFAASATGGLLFYQYRRRQYDDRRMADQLRVRARELDYRVIVERTADCVVKLDASGNHTYVNPAFCALVGVQAKRMVGKSFFERIVETDRATARESLDVALRKGSEQRFQARHETAEGVRHMEWVLCSVVDDQGHRSSLIGVGRDVSAHVAIQDELQNRVRHDSLTGLVNRGHFTEVADTEIARSHRYQHPLAIMLVDLDHFKAVNDTRGHHAGDIALKTCAEVLQQECRESDVAARIGGEEFAVLLPDTDMADAARAAERLRRAIATVPVNLENGDSFHLQASIGVAELLPDESLTKVMQRADAALYAAKQNGRNRIMLAPEETVPLTELQ